MNLINIHETKNGIYYTQTIIASILRSQLDEFCLENNCHVAESNSDCLLSNDDNTMMFYIK